MKNEIDIYIEKMLMYVVLQTGVDRATLLDETDLLGSGIIDSIIAVSIIAFGEEEFGVEVDIGGLPQEAFRTIFSISDLFRQK